MQTKPLNVSEQHPIGVIAGSGNLPEEVVRRLGEQSTPHFVIGFEGITDKATAEHAPHEWVHLGAVGKILKRLKSEGCETVVMVGRVGRPALSKLRIDYGGMKLLSRLRKLTKQGDDVVFRAIVEFIESQGFNVVGADDVLPELLVPEGVLGSVKPDAVAENDIAIGLNAARKIGDLDIGQAVIIQRGLVLGVEGVEGTDRLIERCKELHTEGPGGVLVKVQKPEQDRRVDLPSIGVHTIENAHAHGLRGIAVEAGNALIIGKAAVIKRADELNMFVVGATS